MDLETLLDTAAREALVIESGSAEPHPDDAEAFAHYQATGRPPAGFSDEWHDLVRRNTGRGVAMRRLYLVSDSCSDYEWFVLSVLARHALVGEDVRVGQLADHPGHGHDLWIVDRVLVYPLDGEGRVNLAGSAAFGWLDRFDTAGPLSSRTGIPRSLH